MCSAFLFLLLCFQIKVSVSSGGECLRSYRPDIRKGRYNTIILHVKTTTPDNLLFYLGSVKYVSVYLFYIVERAQLHQLYTWHLKAVDELHFVQLSFNSWKDLHFSRQNAHTQRTCCIHVLNLRNKMWSHSADTYCQSDLFNSNYYILTRTHQHLLQHNTLLIYGTADIPTVFTVCVLKKCIN